MKQKAPLAVKKLEEEQRDVNKITIPEIAALLFVVYRIDMKESKHRKTEFVKALTDEMENDITKYDDYIRGMDQTGSTEVSAEETLAAQQMAPKAAKKLEDKGRDVNKITIPEIAALLFFVYHIDMKTNKHKKPEFVKALIDAMANDITKYDDYFRGLDQTGSAEETLPVQQIPDGVAVAI